MTLSVEYLSVQSRERKERKLQNKQKRLRIQRRLPIEVKERAYALRTIQYRKMLRGNERGNENACCTRELESLYIFNAVNTGSPESWSTARI